VDGRKKEINDQEKVGRSERRSAALTSAKAEQVSQRSERAIELTEMLRSRCDAARELVKGLKYRKKGDA
jgi:hypothetical protein